MVALPWIILFAPALACLGIVLGNRSSKRWAAILSIAGLGVSFLASLKAFLDFTLWKIQLPLEVSVPWINLPGLHLEFGLLLTPLSILMSLVVTGVGLMIFIYSVGYMADDTGFSRYFAGLAGFAFSMLGIVLANNFVTLFIFWELVGASSYLLIGHWFERPQAAEAGKKAFLVNRIADFGFLIGILMLWSLSGVGAEPKTLNFLKLEERLDLFVLHGNVSVGLLGLIGALLFCGVVGKSAQFPLHVWLPDAMEGPTPVSALIHAATMVAAGVYLMARLFFLFSLNPFLLQGIAILGVFTAFFAASLAIVENDLKRVLAYSTLSQLGYMVMALGLGSPVVGMYHLTTHAFFKALLFLGAGCVIHALHTNDLKQMGGLTKSMPVTSATFFIASLALCGIFPLSGFWSKDEILTLAFTQNQFLWIVATITAGMTAFYMGRVWCLAFGGEPKIHAHHHEAPRIMTGPLIVLAVLSVVGGYGIPGLLHEMESAHAEFNPFVALVSTLVALSGLGLAYGLYRGNWRPVKLGVPAVDWMAYVLRRKYFVDDLYRWLNQNVQQRWAILLSLFERYVIIGLWANGIAKVTGLTGSLVRRAQTGKVQAYALTLLGGLTILLYFSLR